MGTPRPTATRGGRGGARPNSGRKPGSRNKATIAREEAARAELEAKADRMREEEAEARRKGVKLGKTVLEEFYTVFAGMAAYYQPDPAGQKKGADEKKFLQYAELACLNAYRAAAFQSPTFKAIAVTAPGGQGGALLPAPASDPKVIDLQAVDPARAADTYRRLIAAATNAA